MGGPRSRGLVPERGRVSCESPQVTGGVCGAGILPASEQTAALGNLNQEIRACNSCCETGVLGAGLGPGLEEASGGGVGGLVGGRPVGY